MQNDIVKPPTIDKSSPPEAAPVVQDVIAAPAAQQSPEKPLAQAPQTSELTQTEQFSEPDLSADELTPEAVEAKKAQKKKSGAPKGIIFLAFVMCIGLIGLSVYMATSESKKLDQPNQAAQSTATDSPKPTKPDTQGALAETDTLPVGTDDPEAELTDQTLGL